MLSDIWELGLVFTEIADELEEIGFLYSGEIWFRIV